MMARDTVDTDLACVEILWQGEDLGKFSILVSIRGIRKREYRNLT